MALNTSALFFNGTTQYGKLNAVTSVRGLSSFAVGAFFTVGVNSVNDSQHLYVERQGTGTLNRLTITPVKDKLTFYFSPKDGVAPTAYTYKTKWDDRWHFAAFIVRISEDNPTYEIVLDGTSVADGTLIVPSGVTEVSDTAPKGVYIGNHSKLASGESFLTSTAWHGFLDELVLFNQSVGQGEFNEYVSSDDHWEIDTDPETTNMISYFQFNQNAGSSITDVAVTPNRTGTLYASGVASSALWTLNRPFLGDGLIDTTVPTTPTTNAHTNLTHDGFDATWNTSTDNVWVQFYELHVSEFNNFATYTAYDTGRLQNMAVRGLLPATNYYWRVRAFDAELNASGYSATRSLTTPSIGDVAPPEPPTNLSASFLTHSSFRLSFVHSISGDALGYKLDIATDADFANILSDYRNQDIGNVSFIDIFGLSGLTSYYVRLRAYDAFDNESNDSLVLRVNTPRPPDVTAPLVATMHTATGISSQAATLNWAEGVDDTAVVGYYLDISTASDFTSYVTANGISWNSVDVGNVTSYRVEGLEPATIYYYRVRAFDEAGNVAGNVSEGQQFETQIASLYEGGLIETLESPLEWKTNAFDAPTIISVDGSSSARFLFDLTTNVGTIDSVIFSFRPREWAPATVLGNINVRVQVGDIDETMVGPTITANVTQLDDPMEIDITSLVSGNNSYVVELSSGGFDGYIDSGVPVETFNDDLDGPQAPYLRVQSDPLSSTQALPFVFDLDYDDVGDNPTINVTAPYLGDNNENNSVDVFFKRHDDDAWIPNNQSVTVNRTLKTYETNIGPVIEDYNMLHDPSAEGTMWDNVTFDTTKADTGLQSVMVTPSLTGFLDQWITVTAGQTYTFQAQAWSDTGALATIGIQFFTGVSGSFLGNAVSEGVYSSEGWVLATVSATAPPTATRATVFLTTVDGDSWFDSFQLNVGDTALPYRDGTMADAAWSGATDASTTDFTLAAETDYHVMFRFADPDGFMDNTEDLSYEHSATITTLAKPDNVFTATTLDLVAVDNQINAILNYEGDDNLDATVRFEFKRTDLSVWSEARPTYERGLKRITTSIPNLKYGTNYTVRAIITDADGVYGAVGGIVTETVTTAYLMSAIEDEPHIDFGGFTLMGRTDRKIGVRRHNAFGFPDRRVEIEDLPRLDGAMQKQALWGRKTIRMEGFVSGDSRTDLLDVRDSLAKGLAASQQRLIVDTLGHTGRFYYATCESLDMLEDAEENITHLPWDATFVCADPFAYNISETVMPTFSASNLSSIAITNVGDVTTNPVFSITTTHAYPIVVSFSNDTTGERIAPKTTIISGDRFIVDTNRRSITKNGIEIDYAGSFPTLASGGNTISFQLSTTSGVPTISVDLRWREKFL